MANELDFEKEFMSDEEVEEMLDGLLTTVEEQVKEEESKTSFINFKRVQEVLYTYKVLKYLTKGKGVKVTYELNQPFNSMGSVSICGKNLTFDNPKWFIIAVKLASNFNVYTKTDGGVQMDFTFHGLTTPIE